MAAGVHGNIGMDCKVSVQIAGNVFIPIRRRCLRGAATSQQKQAGNQGRLKQGRLSILSTGGLSTGGLQGI